MSNVEIWPRILKGKTSKMLEIVLEEKRREIIKEWINSGRIKV
jgi:hypothetical protein